MKSSLTLILTCLLSAFASFHVLQAQTADLKTYAEYERYAAANQVADAPVAVFMGNSIFDNWNQMDSTFFSSHNYACRGISGQVTAQMLARFRSDVIALHPKVVVILAGTNDIARNNLYVPEEKIADNIISMAQLAQTNGITPVIVSILPVASYPWRQEITQVPDKIKKVNQLLQAYTLNHGIPYVNLFDKMKDANDGLPETLSYDGVHPTLQGYAVMQEEIVPVISRLCHQ